ncbi:MAG: sterol desaturase family protein, partial [SAR324 cluster bacterium]|nr:sterol desaturase family protein [SAR324 cluster bacterium]
MNRFMLENEILIRLGFFCCIFTIVAIWEMILPRRNLSASKLRRWYSNLSIVLINSLVVRWIFPVLAVGLAIELEKLGWGLFNKIELAWSLKLGLSILILDFVIYVQHAMFHTVPLFWRLHRMHHTDLDYDVTTGSRFHPLEIVLSMLIKLSTIALLGPLPVAVLIFEVLLNGTAMFNHGNIKLSEKVDRIIRWVIVTPDMHRVHHSVIPSETNSNFGFNVPWWDRLFRTYRDQPRAGHTGMTIGLN